MRALALLLLGTTACGAPPTTDGDARPNIVFILADDLGYGDLGCFGQKTLTTPHLDRMAAEGIRFTQHYSGSTVCAPSRCVLLTGLHTGHARIRGNGRALLRPEDVLVSELLKEAGYRTGCTGKWGVGNPPPDDDPNRHGFDFFYGYVSMFHAHNFFPEFVVRDGERVKLRNVLYDKWKSYTDGRGVARKKVDYLPDLVHAEALKFIERNKDVPFFLYYAFNTPHANNEGGRSPTRDGMEVPSFGEFAMREWKKEEKGFATMIRNLDRYVGEVISKLKELGLDGKTLVLFSSDNGPHQEGGHQMEFFDSNGELRGMKRDLYEGGVRVPLIARWPGRIPAGRVTGHISAFQDFLPTAAAVAGIDAPGTDGISYLPTLLGRGAQKKHDHLYWEFLERGGRKAVLLGRWKGVRLNTIKNPGGPIELYDVTADRSEKEDVSKDHPEIVARIAEILEREHAAP